MTTALPSEVIESGYVGPRTTATPTPPPRRGVEPEVLIAGTQTTAWVSLLLRYYGPLVFSLISWFIMWRTAIEPELARMRVDWDKQVQAAQILNEATLRLERMEIQAGGRKP